MPLTIFNGQSSIPRLRDAWLLLGVLLFSFIAACQDPAQMKAKNKNNSLRLRLSKSASPEEIQAITKEAQRQDQEQWQAKFQALRVLDLEEAFQQASLTELPEAQKVVLSDFRQSNARRLLRVKIDSKGSRSAWNSGDIDERIWSLLQASAPEPYELRLAQNIDKHEPVWGEVFVEFRRSNTRLKRPSKTAALRSNFRFEFRIQFKGPEQMLSNWANWELKYEDEFHSDAERQVSEAFWIKLSKSLPSLTVQNEEASKLWLRTQGFFADIIAPESLRRLLPLPKYQYFEEGCLLYRDEQGYAYRQLHAPNAKARRLDSAGQPLELRCTRSESFVASLLEQYKIELSYYARSRSKKASQVLHFQTAIEPSALWLHSDPELLCLLQGLSTGAGRNTEIQCLGRREGKLRWQSLPLKGATRAFAKLPEGLVLVHERGLAAISHRGQVQYLLRCPHSALKSSKALFCQRDSTVVYASSPKQFVAFNAEEQKFLWGIETLDTQFIHCALHNRVLLSEAGGYLLAFELDSAKPSWRFRSVNAIRDAISFGKQLFLLLNQALYVLDLEDGKVLAEIPLSFPAERFIQLGSQLYIAGPQGILSLTAF